MLILMKQHGRAIVCSIVAVLTLGMIGSIQVGESKGLLQIAYQTAASNAPQEGTESGADIDAVQAVSARSKPEIVYVRRETKLGERVNLDAMFSATDADGAAALVEIIDIFDSFGVSMLYATDADREQKNRIFETTDFSFSKIGAYTLRVKAVDAENKVSYGQYKILVAKND